MYLLFVVQHVMRLDPRMRTLDTRMEGFIHSRAGHQSMIRCSHRISNQVWKSQNTIIEIRNTMMSGVYSQLEGLLQPWEIRERGVSALSSDTTSVLVL